MSLDHWERHAGWWQREFTGGADPEYEHQILPLVVDLLAGCRRVVELGAGEGQVSRALASAGVPEVVAVEPVGEHLDLGRARAGGPRFVRATAEALPLATASCDGAVICLVLEHVDDHVPVVDEVARVLAPGGRFALLLNHPLLQTPGSGWIDDHILDEQYWRIGEYLAPATTLEEVSPGVELPFVHRPLSRYVNALTTAGLVIERMDEPPPPAAFIERAPEYRAQATIPRLLALLCRRVGGGG